MTAANAKTRVLIVDDKPANLFALEQILGKLDVVVHKASTGEQALALTLDNDFAVILLDVQMPGMDGYEVAELLRSEPRTSNIPIIFITAIDRNERYEIKGYETGAVDFIFKPFNESILLGKVKVFVELHKARMELLDSNRNLEVAVEKANLMAEEAIKGAKAKGEFLANMSHEIRTPMNAIMGFSDLLAEEGGLSEQQSEYIEIVRSSGRGLLQIIDDILDLSKLQAGKFQTVSTECGLKNFIDDIAALMAPMAEKKGLKFTLDWRHPIPSTIWADPVRVRQCLINIIGNAVKFTDAGHIKLTTSVNDDPARTCIRFDVEDTGIGIAEDHLEMVLDPFTQVDGGSCRKFGGTGLGLAVTAQLVEFLGGKLAIRSELGIGSTFSLTIPILSAADPQTEPELSSQPQSTERDSDHCGQQSARRILVAEDTITNQLLVRRILEKQGYEVTVACDGNEAVQRALTADFDLILMDMQMPRMNGYEATASLRNSGYSRPIIALTAHAMKDDRRKCLDAGCDDYLSKPIDRKTLLAALEKYLSAETCQAEPSETPAR